METTSRNPRRLSSTANNSRAHRKLSGTTSKFTEWTCRSSLRLSVSCLIQVRPETAPTDRFDPGDRLFRANPSHQLDQADGRVALFLHASDRMLMRTRQHPEPSTLRRLDRNAAFLQDDAFLKPVIEDDALLRMLPFPFTASSS